MTAKIKYWKSLFPWLLLTLLFSIYLYFKKGNIVSKNIVTGILLLVMARGFDIGMTYIGIKRGVGEERNPDAEELIEKYGYLRTYLIQSAIVMILFFFLYYILPIAVYFVLMYWFVSISLIAGLRWAINIVRGL